MQRSLLLLLVPFMLASTGGAAEPCQVHVILFVPADVPVPNGYQQRMNQTIAYTESFLRTGLERWGHKESVSPFRHNQDGSAEVILVRGGKPAAAYQDASLHNEAIASARKSTRIDPLRQVWWVFVYKGDRPIRFSNYRGGFDPKVGGWSVCNFDTRPGSFQPTDLLGNDLLTDLTLKGMIHELGHGFQLPHIGPRLGDNGGNTLMGPTHANYRRIVPKREPRVYLSEAAAAMMAQHPAFRGKPDDRRQLPKLQVADQRYLVDRREKAIVVSGRVQANVKPAFAIVADESDARPGEYWTKHYVAPVAANGQFAVKITEPAAAAGTLKTWFVFANGAMTGNGRLRGKAGAIAKPYQYLGGTFRF